MFGFARPAVISVAGLCLAICSFTGSAGESLKAEPPKQETPLETAKRLSGSKEQKDRVQALQSLKLLGQPGKPEGDEALARYGDLCLRFHAEGEKGTLTEAKRAFTDLKEKSHSRWGLKAKVGLLRIDAAEGRREEAMKGLDWFLTTQGKDDAFIEAAYYLGCLYADAQDDLKQLELAKKPLNYALRLLADQKNYYLGDITADQIRGKLNWINNRIREIRTGPLKLAFEKAEGLKAAGKFDEAIKLYEWIIKEEPKHELAELSGLRICECTLLKKDLQGAIAKAKAFVAENPLGPWRGHAHLLIGDIYLERLFDIGNSEPEFRCILDPERAQPKWVEQERQKMLSTKKSDTDTTPPVTFAGQTWTKVMADAHERVGIVEYVRKNFDKAGDHFQKSFDLRPDKSYGEGVPTGMALVAEKCHNKEPVVPEFLLGAPNERAALVLVMASIYYEGWKYPEAKALYLRVAENDLSKETSIHQRAFATLRMGACASLDGNKSDEAIAWYAKFDSKEFNQSVFAAEALNQWACLLTRLCKTDDAAKVYEKAFTLYPSHPRASTALFNRAFIAYCTENSDVALGFYNLYLQRYPNGPGVERARRMADRIRKEMAESAGKKPAQVGGTIQ